MQIYLAKPGGPKEGPYPLERINADLAVRRYRDDAFWAWHIGLTAWVPLYSVGGVAGAADTTFFFAKPVPKGMPAPASPPEPPAAGTTMFLAKRYGAELAQQQPQRSDHCQAARSAAAPVTDPLRVEPQPPANPEAAGSSPTPVAKPCPEPAKAATITPAASAAGTATAASERQESQTLAAPPAAHVVAAAQTKPTMTKCPPLADTPPADLKVTATAESKDQEPQTPVHPSAPRSIASTQAALASEQPRTAPKTAAPAQKNSSSPCKSLNGKPKARVGPQVAKSAKPFPIPNRRARSMRRGVLLAAR